MVCSQRANRAQTLSYKIILILISWLEVIVSIFILLIYRFAIYHGNDIIFPSGD